MDGRVEGDPEVLRFPPVRSSGLNPSLPPGEKGEIETGGKRRTSESRSTVACSNRYPSQHPPGRPTRHPLRDPEDPPLLPTSLGIDSCQGVRCRGDPLGGGRETRVGERERAGKRRSQDRIPFDRRFVSFQVLPSKGIEGPFRSRVWMPWFGKRCPSSSGRALTNISHLVQAQARARETRIERKTER